MRRKRIEDALRFLTPVLLATALWGSAFPGVKIAFSFLQIDADNIAQQMYFAGLRFIPAGLLVFAVAAARKKTLVPRRENWPPLLLMSGMQVVLYYGLYFYGLAHTSSVRTAILNATPAFFTVGFAHLLGMERLTLRRAAGCLAGFLGILVMNAGGGAGGFTFRGEGLLLLAMASDGISKLISRSVTRGGVDPLVANAWQMVLGGGVLLLAGLCGGGRFGAFPVRGALWLGYLAVVSAVTFTLWMGLLKRYDIGSVSVCSFLTPVFGTLATAALLPQEGALSPRYLLALLLICCGVVIVNARVRRGKSVQA